MSSSRRTKKENDIARKQSIEYITYKKVCKPLFSNMRCKYRDIAKMTVSELYIFTNELLFLRRAFADCGDMRRKYQQKWYADDTDRGHEKVIQIAEKQAKECEDVIAAVQQRKEELQRNLDKISLLLSSGNEDAKSISVGDTESITQSEQSDLASRHSEWSSLPSSSSSVLSTQTSKSLFGVPMISYSSMLKK